MYRQCLSPEGIVPAGQKLQWGLFLLFATGIFLLFYEGFNLCLFKRLTGFPCSACGTGRGLSLLLDGDVYGAVRMNPLSVLVAVSAVLTFPVIIYDLLNSTYRLQFLLTQISRVFVKNKWLYIVLVAVVLLNWYWNLIKFS